MMQWDIAFKPSKAINVIPAKYGKHDFTQNSVYDQNGSFITTCKLYEGDVK